MKKKTRLVPFNWEKYQKGAKAVFRDYDANIINILHSGLNETYPIVTLFCKGNTSGISWSCEDGTSGRRIEHYMDILLEEEIEEKTFYVNTYKEQVRSSVLVKYSSAEDALTNRDGDAVGTLKVTYTEEDLIK